MEKKKNLKIVAVIMVVAITVGWFPASKAQAASLEPYLMHYQMFEGFYINDKAPSENKDWRVDLRFSSDVTLGTIGEFVGKGRVIAQKYVWNDDTLRNETKAIYYGEGEVRRVKYGVFKIYLPDKKYVKFKITNGNYPQLKVIKTNIKIKKMGPAKTPKGYYTIGMNPYTSDWSF